MSDESTRGGTRRHVGRAVRKEVRIDASPEAIYDAWAKPEEIARWFVDRAEGEMAPGETVTWVFESFGYRIPVEVFEAEPGEHLAFGGEPPGRPPALQEVTIEREGGVSVLRLVNSGFLEGPDWDEELDGVDSGWEMALATLKLQLERYPGRRRHHRIVVRPVGEAPYESVSPLFTTREGLERWIGGSARLGAEPPAVGSGIRLAPEGLPELDGEVLATPGHELLLSWPAVDGVLGLKSFRLGPEGRRVALDLGTWPGDGVEPPAAVTEWLDRAVERLAAVVANA